MLYTDGKPFVYSFMPCGQKQFIWQKRLRVRLLYKKLSGKFENWVYGPSENFSTNEEKKILIKKAEGEFLKMAKKEMEERYK